MAKENSNGQAVIVIPKFISRIRNAGKLLQKKKKIIFAVLFILFILYLYNLGRSKNNNPVQAKSVSVEVAKSYEMTALTNQGKTASNKVRLSISSAEKTNQVLVKDQTFTATNKKLFLILNLELKNDATYPVNIMPGDLVRLTFGNSDENKFAPDLHNNLVLVAAISTKTDRVGFVIPQEEKNFKLYVGELEGKKEEIQVIFPS